MQAAILITAIFSLAGAAIVHQNDHAARPIRRAFKRLRTIYHASRN